VTQTEEKQDDQVVKTGKHLVISEDQDFLEPWQLAAFKMMEIDGIPQGQQALFVHVVNRTKLDPFAGQIYLIERKGQNGPTWTIQTGIDGYRVVSRRVAKTLGVAVSYEDTMWCGDDGVWKDVWLDEEPPKAAKVTVKLGESTFPGIAMWREYAPYYKKNGELHLTPMWEARGAGQLAKCAEALALRKACPNDLSGLYTAEEMEKAHQEEEQADQAFAIQAAAAAAKQKAEEPEVVDGEVVEDPEMAAAEVADRARWTEILSSDANPNQLSRALERVRDMAKDLGLSYDDVDEIANSVHGAHLVDLGVKDVQAVYKQLAESK
jgi:phage recombination protein Bet